MKYAHDMSYIRQLCNMERGTGIVVPEVLRTLSKAIHSAPSILIRLTQDLRTSYLLPETVIPHVIDLYRKEWAYLEPPALRPNIARWFASHSVLSDVSLLVKDFYNSELFNLILRPYHLYPVSLAAIKVNNQLKAILMFSHARQEGPNNQQDQDLPVQCLPYLAHTLHNPASDNEIDYIYSGRSGSVLLEATGQAISLTENINEFLYMSYNPIFSDASGMALPSILMKLRQRLDAIFKDDAVQSLVWQQQNPWGKFIFHAQAMRPPQSMVTPEGNFNLLQNRLAMVTVEYHEPIPLRLMRTMKNLPLSAREREVSLYLTQGLSQAEIAKRLQVQPSSVITYVKRIYQKLDVHHHVELFQKLLIGDSSLPKAVEPSNSIQKVRRHETAKT